MPILLPLASGKGGVGKSAIAANLASTISRHGKRTILADLDWGGSNAHTLLGLKNNHQGMDRFIQDKTVRLADLTVDVGRDGLGFIPGDGLVPGTANMPFIRKQRLIKELKELEADYVVIDLGAGTHYNTVDVFLACGMGMVVTTPEPTAILNAYSFLKTALFRLLRSAFSAKHPARALVNDFFAGRIETAEGAGGSIAGLFAAADSLDPAAAAKLRELHGRFQPRVVVNMGKKLEELTLGGRLRMISGKHLGIAIEYIAYLPWDDQVRTSIMERRLLCESAPDSPFAVGVAAMADRILNEGFGQAIAPIEHFEDLNLLAEQAAEGGYFQG